MQVIEPWGKPWFHVLLSRRVETAGGLWLRGHLEMARSPIPHQATAWTTSFSARRLGLCGKTPLRHPRTTLERTLLHHLSHNNSPQGGRHLNVGPLLACEACWSFHRPPRGSATMESLQASRQSTQAKTLEMPQRSISLLRTGLKTQLG